MNMGNMLFRGLELNKDNPDMVTVTGLAILAAALPFQAIFFLINSYIREFENANDIDQAMKIIAGSARSMGLEVVEG